MLKWISQFIVTTITASMMLACGPTSSNPTKDYSLGDYIAPSGKGTRAQGYVSSDVMSFKPINSESVFVEANVKSEILFKASTKIANLSNFSVTEKSLPDGATLELEDKTEHIYKLTWKPPALPDGQNIGEADMTVMFIMSSDHEQTQEFIDGLTTTYDIKINVLRSGELPKITSMKGVENKILRGEQKLDEGDSRTITLAITDPALTANDLPQFTPISPIEKNDSAIIDGCPMIEGSAPKIVSLEEKTIEVTLKFTAKNLPDNGKDIVDARCTFSFINAADKPSSLKHFRAMIIRKAKESKETKDSGEKK